MTSHQFERRQVGTVDGAEKSLAVTELDLSGAGPDLGGTGGCFEPPVFFRWPRSRLLSGLDRPVFDVCRPGKRHDRSCSHRFHCSPKTLPESKDTGGSKQPPVPPKTAANGSCGSGVFLLAMFHTRLTSR
jgi:hypothetical protein